MCTKESTDFRDKFCGTYEGEEFFYGKCDDINKDRNLDSVVKVTIVISKLSDSFIQIKSSYLYYTINNAPYLYAIDSNVILSEAIARNYPRGVILDKENARLTEDSFIYKHTDYYFPGYIVCPYKPKELIISKKVK